MRQWEFWRAGFWRRPLLVMLASLVLIAVAPFLLADVPADLAAGRALDRGRVCTAHNTPSDGCLVPVPGILDGPHGPRAPRIEWWLYRDDGRGVLDFDVGLGSGLHGGQSAVALTFDDGRVAAVVVGGRTLRTREAGPEGALLAAVFALLVAATGLVGLGYAWIGWRRTGSLVSVNGHGWDDSRLSRLCRYGLLGVIVVLGCVAVVVMLGAPWGAGLVPLLLVGAAVLIRGRSGRSSNPDARHIR